MEPEPAAEPIPEPQPMEDVNEEEVGEINCPSCNATNSGDSALCYSCGASLKASEISIEIEAKEPEGVEQDEEKPKSKSVKIDDMEIELFTTDDGKVKYL